MAQSKNDHLGIVQENSERFGISLSEAIANYTNPMLDSAQASGFLDPIERNKNLPELIKILENSLSVYKDLLLLIIVLARNEFLGVDLGLLSLAFENDFDRINKVINQFNVVMRYGPYPIGLFIHPVTETEIEYSAKGGAVLIHPQRSAAEYDALIEPLDSTKMRYLSGFAENPSGSLQEIAISLLEGMSLRIGLDEESLARLSKYIANNNAELQLNILIKLLRNYDTKVSTEEFFESHNGRRRIGYYMQSVTLINESLKSIISDLQIVCTAKDAISGKRSDHMDLRLTRTNLNSSTPKEQ